MTESPLDHICFLLDYNRKKARALYTETFGNYKSPAIEEELQKVANLAHALGSGARLGPPTNASGSNSQP